MALSRGVPRRNDADSKLCMNVWPSKQQQLQRGTLCVQGPI